MFAGHGEEMSDGAIRIEMVGEPRFLVVRLYDDRDKKSVEVNINGVVIGTFQEYAGQGYRYKFIQRRRTGIRDGRTTAEQYMEDICISHKDILRLERAYH